MSIFFLRDLILENTQVFVLALYCLVFRILIESGIPHYQ